MKIALVHKRLDLSGGTERDLVQTAKGLRDLGHEVHLFCSEYKAAVPKEIVAHSIPVIPLGRTVRLWSFAWRAPAVIARANCDIVISFGRLLRQDILRCGGGTDSIRVQYIASGVEAMATLSSWKPMRVMLCPAS